MTPRLRWLVRESLRAGTLAGLAMMPLGLAARAAGLRINEYGPKTLALVLRGEPAHPAAAGFAQHLLISWLAAPPLLLAASRCATRARRVLCGLLYGAGFYGLVNSLALPRLFGDPTPWELGAAVVAPSLAVHLVYGAVIALALRERPPVAPAR